MTVSEKTKTTDHKIEQNKAQCNLNKLLNVWLYHQSVNVSKNKFLTGKYV